MPGKYKRPDNLPGRVCRVLEVLTLEEMKSKKESLSDTVYRFTHIANGCCENPHDDWMADFVELEASLEVGGHLSPLEREENDAEAE